MSDARLQAQCESRLGSTLRGKWVLEKLIGVGGMAAVYAGAHKIGRRDAIKILHPEVAKSTELRTRFEQEAAVANSFNHPGAVEIRDIDVTEDGCPFLVMEFLSGETMGEWARRHFEKGEAFPLDEVLRFAEELLSALGAAHAQGIVHRDIKLDNIFITETGSVKVLDFGIARLAHGRAITVAGARLGTAAYMAPEQVRGEQVDGRADLFSVGATLFRLIAKRRIHEAQSEADLFIRMGSEPAPALLSVAPDAHPDLAAIIDRALKFRADERYPNAAAMAADLQRLRAQGLGKRVDGGLSRTVPLSMAVLKAALHTAPGPESTTARTDAPPPSMGSAPTNPILPRASVSKLSSDPTQAIAMGSLATMMQPTPQPPPGVPSDVALREVPAPAPSVRGPSATVMQPQVLRDVAAAAVNVAVSSPLAKGSAMGVAPAQPGPPASIASAPPPGAGPVSVAPQHQQKFSLPPASEVVSSRSEPRGPTDNAEWVRAGPGLTMLREKPSGPPWILIAGIAIVLAIGVGATLAIMSSGKGSDSTASDTNEESAEAGPKKADKKRALPSGTTSAAAPTPVAPTATAAPAPTSQPTQTGPAPNPANPSPQPTTSSFLRPSFSSFNIPKLPR